MSFVNQVDDTLNDRVQTHPQQNMIASGSIDSDLAIRIWVDTVRST